METFSGSILRRITANVALMMASLLVASVLIEIAVRVVFGEALQYEYDENILYRPVPHQKGFPSNYYLPHATVNSLGMRGSEPNSTAKFRILVIGDSHAFGVGLKDNETLSAVLERKFQQNYGVTVAVANGGVPGYGLYQIAGLLKKQLEKFRSQRVVLLYSLGMVERQRPDANVIAAYHPQIFLQKLATYHVLKVLYIEVMHRFDVEAYRLPTERYAAQLPVEIRFHKLWAIEEKNFQAIYNLTREANAHLVVIAHTPIKDDREEYVKEQLRRFCSEHAIPLFEYFRRLASPAYYVPRDGHYSALFYEELVDEIFKQKFDQRLLNTTTKGM
jgi:hypothetical protein